MNKYDKFSCKYMVDQDLDSNKKYGCSKREIICSYSKASLYELYCERCVRIQDDPNYVVEL